MQIINESQYPGSILGHLTAWALYDLTPLELELLSDSTVIIAKMPDDFIAGRDEEGIAFPSGIAYVYLRPGYAGIATLHDFAEACVMVTRHEVQHLLQFAYHRLAVASTPTLSPSLSSDTGEAATVMGADEDVEQRAMIERIVDEKIKEFEAEDEAEAARAGDARLEAWRDLSTSQRDAIKFGKLETPAGHWG
jgi:hypothetical protein